MSTPEGEPPDVYPEKSDLWDILGDLGYAISIVEVTERSLQYQAIAGSDRATLEVAIEMLLNCHERFDEAARRLEAASLTIEVGPTEEGKQQGEGESQG